jgi:hypothetical protein
MGEHSQSEIAAFLDISEGAVRKRLHDARRVLKGHMLDMVRDVLRDDAPSRDERFEKHVLSSALPLQVFVVTPAEGPGAERGLGSTTAGRDVDVPKEAVWVVEPRLDVAGDDENFEALLAEMKERRIPGLRTGGRLSDRHLPRLAELADHLVYLDLSGGDTGITDEGLRHLAALPRLRYLNVNLNGPCSSPALVPADVTDAGLQFLSSLTDMEELRIDNLFRVGDAPMRHLRAMPRLRLVSMAGTMVTDAGLANLDGLEHLESLTTGPLTTDDGLAVLRRVPAFVDRERPRAHLDMNKSPLVGEAGLRSLDELSGLVELSLCDARLLRDRWVGHLDADLPGSAAYTGAGVGPLANLPHVRAFSMSGDRQDDDALEHIGRFRALTALSCAVPTSGDRGWRGLARSPSITRLGAIEARGLTGTGVAALATMSQLTELGVGGPNLLDDDLAPLADRATCAPSPPSTATPSPTAPTPTSRASPGCRGCPPGSLAPSAMQPPSTSPPCPTCRACT